MKKIIEVPYIDQSLRWPTGCESVSAVMLLQYLGYDLTVDDFIRRYLDCRDFQQRPDGLYGPDPFEHFCGSPYDEDSFGCYAPVICRALSKIVEKDYQVVDETGTDTKQLLHQYIDQGMPVIYWACINMRPPVTGPSWKLLDSRETFTWTSNEHCMLLTGYDETSLYFHDPYENHGLTAYPREVVCSRHKAQREMAVALRKI